MTAQLQRLIDDARGIFQAALAGVAPARLLLRRPLCELARRPLADYARIVVVGVGKAAIGMARSIEEQLGDRLTEGLITVPHGYRDQAGDAALPRRIELTEAGHPVPDEAGRRAAERALAAARGCGPDDLLVVLVSGGGSALWPAFAEDLSLDDARATFNALLASGASIHEVNAVRKHLSRIGGGRLAAAARPAEVAALLISDVPGDDPGVIASGLTVPDRSTWREALDVVRRYGIEQKLPAAVLCRLERGAVTGADETLKPGDPVFANVTTRLCGSNRDALAAARDEACRRGYSARIADGHVEGEAREVGRRHVRTLRDAAATGPLCLIWGGETTVTLRGDGMGGRNQELALAAALAMEDAPRAIAFLSGGTDGIDGPTAAAGAVVTPATVRAAREAGLAPEEALARNDAWTFFSRLPPGEGSGGHLITGPTQTNVMDVHIGLIGG